MWMHCRFDALTGYLSALLRDDSGSNGSGGGLEAAAAAGWPATHVIGKDILRFHAVRAPSRSLNIPLLAIDRHKFCASKTGSVCSLLSLEPFSMSAAGHSFLWQVCCFQKGSVAEYADHSHKRTKAL
jgi:hypothetical protein